MYLKQFIPVVEVTQDSLVNPGHEILTWYTLLVILTVLNVLNVKFSLRS